MSLRRRSLLAALPALALMPRARAEDARLTPRMIGNPNAKVKVGEWFSLTCTHCAHFQMTVFPEVKQKLIDTGKICYVYHDFPLDQVALLAAMLARSLPIDRYEPFVESLLSSQDRWAFARDIDPKQQLQRMAALAGLSAEQFQKIDQDDAFRQAIVNMQDADQAKYNIGGTPYFRFNETPYTEELLTYDAFAKQVEKAAG
ncbi:thioredoxin domain-containing protein [Kozakia baliensis]|uniref:thioredoxin domain-containing protein n=1 Tax=Kozakia baliensis TaxID=153496 RepID=UPI00345BED22